MAAALNILADDLTALNAQGPAFVTLGEVMVRDTPADEERLERTRQVHLSMAGSEFTLAMGLQRLGVQTAFITRTPDNPYGWALRDLARSQGIDTSHFVWAPRAELMGRLLYEIGRTPRKDLAYYQRMHSAASRLGAGMVDWATALRNCRLLHASGITFGLSTHSGYERNYCLEALSEALAARPAGCLVGMDYNYRSTLWSGQQAVAVLTPLLVEHVDVLITSIEDMAQLYGLGAGRYSAADLVRGDFERIDDEDLVAFLQGVLARFDLRIAAVTIRYPDTFEQHRWESAALDTAGHYYRSEKVRTVVLSDRLGGGDTWNAGFYYGLLTESDPLAALRKGVQVGDALTLLKQTLMFDLPIVTKGEVQALLNAQAQGGGKRTER
ncbi:MAG: sugar kinase [Anaerolineales bacterium]